MSTIEKIREVRNIVTFKNKARGAKGLQMNRAKSVEKERDYSGGGRFL